MSDFIVYKLHVTVNHQSISDYGRRLFTSVITAANQCDSAESIDVNGRLEGRGNEVGGVKRSKFFSDWTGVMGLNNCFVFSVLWIYISVDTNITLVSLFNKKKLPRPLVKQYKDDLVTWYLLLFSALIMMAESQSFAITRCIFIIVLFLFVRQVLIDWIDSTDYIFVCLTVSSKTFWAIKKTCLNGHLYKIDTINFTINNSN